MNRAREDDPRADWTPADYEHEAQMMEVLRTKGWKEYCALRDAEMQRVVFLLNVGWLQ
jgi:hypothetical protein